MYQGPESFADFVSTLEGTAEPLLSRREPRLLCGPVVHHSSGFGVEERSRATIDEYLGLYGPLTDRAPARRWFKSELHGADSGLQAASEYALPLDLIRLSATELAGSLSEDARGSSSMSEFMLGKRGYQHRHGLVTAFGRSLTAFEIGDCDYFSEKRELLGEGSKEAIEHLKSRQALATSLGVDSVMLTALSEAQSHFCHLWFNHAYPERYALFAPDFHRESFRHLVDVSRYAVDGAMRNGDDARYLAEDRGLLVGEPKYPEGVLAWPLLELGNAGIGRA